MGTCTSNCFAASDPADPMEPVVCEFAPPTIELGDLELEPVTPDSGGEIAVEAMDNSFEDIALEGMAVDKTAEGAEDDAVAEEDPPTKPVYPVPMPRATGVVDRSSISFDQGKNFF